MGVLYNSRIVTDGLILCVDTGDKMSYPGAGTVWTDLTSNHATGVLENSPQFDANNAGSILFDGTNDRIDFSSYSSLFDFGTDNFSIGAFIKSTSSPLGQYRCIFFHHYNPGFVLLTMIHSGVARFWLGGTVLNGNTNILDNEWKHVFVTRNGATLTIYVKGAFDNSSTAFSGKSATVSSPMASIGQYPDLEETNNRYPFLGNIALVHIYNRALSAQEIRQNYKATKGRFGL